MAVPIYAEKTVLDSQSNQKWGVLDYANAFARYTSDLLTEQPSGRVIKSVEVVGSIVLVLEAEGWGVWRLEGERFRWLGGRADPATALGWIGAETGVLGEKAPLVAVAGGLEAEHYPLRLYSMPAGHYVNTLRLRAPVLGVRAAGLVTVTHPHCILVFDQAFTKLYEVRTHVFAAAHAANSLAGTLLAFVPPADARFSWAESTRAGLAVLAARAPGLAAPLLPLAEGGGAGEVAVAGPGGVLARWAVLAHALQWSPSGTLLAAAAHTGQQVLVARWAAPALIPLYTLARGVTPAEVQLAWAPDEHWLAALSARGTLHLWPVCPSGAPPSPATHLGLALPSTPADGQPVARAKAAVPAAVLWPPGGPVVAGEAALAYRLQAHLDHEAQQQRRPGKLAARLVPTARHRLAPPTPLGMAWAPAPRPPPPSAAWVAHIDIQACAAAPLWAARTIHFRLLAAGPATELTPSAPVTLARLTVPQARADETFSAEGLARGTTSEPSAGLRREMSEAISTPLKSVSMQDQPNVLAGEDLRQALARSVAQQPFQPVPARDSLQPRAPPANSYLYPSIEPERPLPGPPRLDPLIESELGPERRAFKFAFTDSDDEQFG